MGYWLFCHRPLESTKVFAVGFPLGISPDGVYISMAFTFRSCFLIVSDYIIYSSCLWLCSFSVFFSSSYYNSNSTKKDLCIRLKLPDSHRLQRLGGIEAHPLIANLKDAELQEATGSSPKAAVCQRKSQRVLGFGFFWELL